MTHSEVVGYAVLLIVSGVCLTALAASGFGGKSPGNLAVNGLFAGLFLIYGLYLLLIFDGGTVFVSYYAFVVPILLIVNAFRTRSANKAANDARNEPGYPNPHAAYMQQAASNPYLQQNAAPNPYLNQNPAQRAAPNPYPSQDPGNPATSG